eukprot:TRINITY_DN64887_c0_g1_i1.p1 TRINITY_DN64887_c0_g1~~TRINITY_DN64887_c0_g1_i1.p1  ORF type:complete len:348 (-),score=76.35 TRINITY_DN64887_c0_g1_i1:47-1090(-)
MKAAVRHLSLNCHAARSFGAAGTGIRRRGVSSLASLVAKQASQGGASLAVAAPLQDVSWSFRELEEKAAKVANALSARGYKQGHALVTDLPNSAENLLLQVACSRLGVAVATAKDEKVVAELQEKANLMGAVAQSSNLVSDSPLLRSKLSLEPVLVEELDGSLRALLGGEAANAPTVAPIESDIGTPLGFWGSSKALTNAEALDVMGAAAKDRLAITPEDRVLVSITLCHAFGIGSAVGGAWLGGAGVVLPGASGIRGCGSPSQRAEATLSALVSQRCSILFADVHTLKALPSPQASDDLSALRGGACKVGSGADFLEDVREAKLGPDGEMKPLEYAGVKILAVGKK